MASVVLPRLFLQDAATPTDGIQAYTGTETRDVQSLPVDVRTMANGRVRTVARAGSSRQVTVTLRLLALSDVAWLLAHRGRTVLLRDRSGRKVFGVYSTVSPVEYRDQSGSDCELVLTELTVTEAV